RRLLLCPQRLAAGAGRLELLAEENHYLRRVLRLRGGEQLALLDGQGRLRTARLELVAGRGREPQPPALAVLEQPLAEPLLVQPPPRPALELAVALPRLDADGALRMASELGIDRFTPLQAARSVVPPERVRAQRLQAIVREAVEQCERLWLPQLAPEQVASQWFGCQLAELTGGAAAELRLLATTRRPGLVLLEDLLQAHPGPGAALTVPQWIRLAIGPEGGWTGEDEDQAAAAGWLPVSLGDTILRTSTAAVLAAGWMAAWRRLLRRRGGEFSS
ncbi:MAG: RsmE family RNA methyltransferase, partial [Cyanobium sp.]